MSFTIVSTFQSVRVPYKKHASFFQKLFQELAKKANMVILPQIDLKNIERSMLKYEDSLKKAQIIFHNTGMFLSQFPHQESYRHWLEAMLRARGFCWAHQHHCENREEWKYVHKINTFISTLNPFLIDADIFFKKEEELYTLLEDHKIPTLKRFTQELEKANSFPIVLKHHNTTKGLGVSFIESEEQWKKLFPTQESWQKQKHFYTIMEFVESPSDFFTHYRVYTVGKGHILAVVLCYSHVKKSDDVRIIDQESIYDNPKNPLFLNRRLIASNRTYGGKQIPLHPNSDSRNISVEEQKILQDHAITNQEIPGILKNYATEAAKILSAKGLCLLGQDWIQDKNGNFFCLEMNWGPELGSFDTVYNKGKGDDEETRIIVAQKIAAAIIEDSKQEQKQQTQRMQK